MRLPRRVQICGAAVAVTAGLISSTAMSATGEPSDPVYRVAGLSEPAEIRVDDWGVPHIYADEHYDAFFAQGFNAARDRLFQIDLFRKRGLGRLAESFGPSYVQQDLANRRFMYRGPLDREWLAYGNDAKRIAEAYTSGINAYIEAARRNEDLMPWEFEFLGYEPEKWRPGDVVRLRSHALVGNLASEVERAYFVRDFGFEYEDIRSPLAADWKTKIPKGLNLDVLPKDPDDLLAVYNAATAGVEFSPDDLDDGFFGSATIDGRRVEPSGGSQRPDAGDPDASIYRSGTRGRHEGSNTWAVAPERTATEGPLIASDPHRTQAVPSLRYAAHLNAPGLNVIGAGEPGLPGVSLGHNERIAFGLTIFDIDQEDLYVYRTNPKNPDEYRYRGRWEPMTIEPTSVDVRGGEPVSEDLKFTRHGPVIYEDPDSNVAFAVRTVWSEPGTGAYFGSIEYMRSQNWREFLGAMNRWGTPGENQQYADVTGRIAWKPGGKTPVRHNWDGLLPVPGDGRYEWDSFYPMDKLPMSVDPERGWLQTNNEMRLFDDFENGPEPEYVNRKIGFEALLTARAVRTREVLAEQDEATLRSMRRLQRDNLSVPARTITAALGDVESDQPRVRRALDLLRGWNHRMDNDSAAAALFDVWTDLHGAPGTGDGFLGQAVVDAAVEDPQAAERIGVPHETALLDMISHPRKWFPGDAVAARDRAIVSSLDRATRKLRRDQGADQDAWRYGFYNRQVLRHPFSALVDSRSRRAIDVGPRERVAVGNTVGDDGASWRYVAEPGNWDDAIAMNNPGQSGDPESPLYDNLFEPWATGGSFPLLFSRDAVEKHTRMRIRLLPED